MPLYYFVLKKGRQVIPDREGVELADDKAARAHAAAVVRDLMRNRGASTRAWRIQIHDEDLQLRFELLFASYDEEMKLCLAGLEVGAQRTAKETAALADMISEVQMTLSQVRQTLAQANRFIGRST